jgi:CxxC motif-containing protein (DUF1111 family)
MTVHTRMQTFTLAIIVASFACTRESDVTSEPGEPLPGLTAGQLARFHSGKVAFARIYTPEEGLGPLHTENSCSACHHEPETGGAGGEPDIHASRFFEPDSCDTMRLEGGFVWKQVTPLAAAIGIEPPPRRPPTANGFGFFFPPPLYGLGLIEAIPEETIAAMADPDDSDGDGISGRVSRLADGRIGRFRRKADRASIHDLVGGGASFALGLTTPAYPNELPYKGQPMPAEADPTTEPEMDSETIALIEEYIRYLAPVGRSVPVDEEDRRMILRGEQIFSEIGCATCHAPTLRTGPSEVEALDRKLVPLYSDLLLHDMGPELADVCGPTATPRELRTEMLWGMRIRDRLMHAGRVEEARDAIMLHGGESALSRAAFVRLDVASQLALLRFLWNL